jgi:hypothetical protein
MALINATFFDAMSVIMAQCVDLVACAVLDMRKPYPLFRFQSTSFFVFRHFFHPAPDRPARGIVGGIKTGSRLDPLFGFVVVVWVLV